jgi:hypothetical protein
LVDVKINQFYTISQKNVHWVESQLPQLRWKQKSDHCIGVNGQIVWDPEEWGC